jgi:hypothetical protein
MTHSNELNLTARTVTISPALQFIDDRARSVSLPAFLVHLNPEKLDRV